MLQYNEIREKKIIIYDDEPCEVVESHVARTQQRKPQNQVKLKTLISGKTINATFHVSESADEADIDKKDITTENYGVDPRYQYFDCSSGRLCPPAEIIGYTVNQTVSVKIRNFDIIGDTLSGVVQNGANNVSQLQFTIDDPTEVPNQARAKAIVKAQAKAKAIAKAADFSLGRLLSIDESSQSSPLPMYGGYGIGGDAKLDRAESVPSIEPGSREVNVYVTLTYEIE